MVTLREFKAGLPPYRALLGFDYGSKRLGAAVSDLLLMTATNSQSVRQLTITIQSK